MRDTTHSIKRHAEHKIVDAEHESDVVKRIAEHEFMRLEQSHEQARRGAEERIAILEHTSVAVRRKVDVVVAERDRQARRSRPEFNVVRTEEEQASEAWARVNYELLRTTATSVAQSTHMYQRGHADSDKCKAELLDMTDQYNRAITALHNTRNVLEETKRRWAQQTQNVDQQGQGSKAI